jgi:hypothetical protein
MYRNQNEGFQPEEGSQQSPTHSEEVRSELEASGQLPGNVPTDGNSSSVVEEDRQSNASTHSDTASVTGEAGSTHDDQSLIPPPTSSRLAQVFSYLCCCKGRREENYETSYPAI